MTNIVPICELSHRHKSPHWQPHSWSKFPLAQGTRYQNVTQADDVLSALERSPEIVSWNEILSFQNALQEVAEGCAFILHAGDCAERFQDCDESSVAKKKQLLSALASQLEALTQKKIIIIGRIAGQFFKPRTNEFENFLGENIPVFRGEGINSFGATLLSRTPDPDRLQLAYINSLRAKKYFCQDESKTSPYAWFTSHEGLHLPYEESLVRLEPNTKNYYNASAHFLWIGDRTRSVNGAHAEFFSGLNNPVGIKIGPNYQLSEVEILIDKLTKLGEKRRVILIIRLGLKNIVKLLPPLLKTIQHKNLIWISDPMHGNTYDSTGGLKTRSVKAISEELALAVALHKKYQVPLSGIHLEVAAETVTECTDDCILEGQLNSCYQTFCDPRLNANQASQVLVGLT